MYADADDVPRLILDAGTGLRELPALLDGRPFDGTIVLSHLHWDHLQGLPFCPSVDRPDARTDLLVPGADAFGLLAGAMSPPHFPIGPDGLLGRWRFRSARAGVVAPGVTVAPVAHKGGTTFGIRVELDGARVVYLPDHAPSDASAVLLESAQALADGADVLLHDGQFLASERDTACAYGHATVEDAMRFADRCRVGMLVLTHHAPGRTDDQLDAVRNAVPSTPDGRPVRFARQGDRLDVAAAA